MKEQNPVLLPMILRLQSHSVFHRWEIPLWLLLVLSEILSVLLSIPF